MPLYSALITTFTDEAGFFGKAEPEVSDNVAKAGPSDVAKAKINRFAFVLRSPQENQSSSLRSAKEIALNDSGAEIRISTEIRAYKVMLFAAPGNRVATRSKRDLFLHFESAIEACC